MFGRKNGCRYFIDSENVNEVWVNILNILKPEDIIFLFYTDNSAHISCARAVELINIGAKQIKGIRCKEGNNGLDFQMVTQLGAVISKSPKCEYILVSNDNGFDAVVSYWKQKGYNIRREKSSFCVSLQISDPEKPSATQKKNTNRRQNSGQRYQNRPRLENKKDYKKQTPKLEDKTQQPAGGKTNNRPYENKSYDNKSYEKSHESKTPENKTYDSKSNDSSKSFGSKSASGKTANNSKASDDKASRDRASDNKKVVDLEAKKAKKIEEKKRQEKAREAEKKNRAAVASDEAVFMQDETMAETVREEVVAEAAMEAEAVQAGTVMKAKAELTEHEMEAETVQAETAMEAETVQAETAMEAAAGQTEPMMENEPAQEEDTPEHDDTFEPMEKPMAIPDTAMVADGSRSIDTRYCLQSLCTMISRKNMALFHNALTCIFEQKDGDEIYAAVKSHPELHAQLWIRYEQDREERVRRYLRLLLDVNDCEVQDTDLLYQVYRESYDGSLQGLNIGIMKAFGDEIGVKYYRLLRKHINILTKL